MVAMARLRHQPLPVLTHPSKKAHLASAGALDHGHLSIQLSIPQSIYHWPRYHGYREPGPAAANCHFKQSVKRRKLRTRDRIFWVLLSRLWSNWRSAW